MKRFPENVHFPKTVGNCCSNTMLIRQVYLQDSAMESLYTSNQLGFCEKLSNGFSCNENESPIVENELKQETTRRLS